MAQVIQMKPCPRCNRANIPAATNCGGCGFPMNKPFPLPSPPTPKVAPTPAQIAAKSFEFGYNIAFGLLLLSTATLFYYLFIFDIYVEGSAAIGRVVNLGLMNQRTSFCIGSGIVGLAALLFLLLAEKPATGPTI
jgi:hypothetical protein